MVWIPPIPVVDAIHEMRTYFPPLRQPGIGLFRGGKKDILALYAVLETDLGVWVTFEALLFIVLAVTGIVSALLMITRANPVNSALYLVLNFIALAGLYLTLNAQFVAIMQIVVYAGAIMVLFLFVIMLLNLENEEGLLEPRSMKLYVGAGLSVLFLLIVAMPVWSAVEPRFGPKAENAVELGTIENIGNVLFTGFGLPFEITAMLLLVAMIGAIVLAKKRFP